MPWHVTNVTRDQPLADRVLLADGFWNRFKGLMGRAELPMGEGLHLRPCNSVHTFFMRIPIDVLFLDTEGTVVKLFPALPPWRTTAPVRGVRSVLELPVGVIAASGTRVGDQLRFEQRLPAAGTDAATL